LPEEPASTSKRRSRLTQHFVQGPGKYFLVVYRPKE
jgi:hypothetical protein